MSDLGLGLAIGIPFLVGLSVIGIVILVNRIDFIEKNTVENRAGVEFLKQQAINRDQIRSKLLKSMGYRLEFNDVRFVKINTKGESYGEGEEREKTVSSRTKKKES